MPFRYFCPRAQNYLCNICILDQNQGIDPDWLDLDQKSNEIVRKFDKKTTSFNQLKRRVQSMKSTLRSGKHIDKYFDELIQEIILIHNKIKERHRDRIEVTISDHWEEYEKHNVWRYFEQFQALKSEIDEFKKDERLAEISLNTEHYEAQLAKLEEVEWEFGTHYADLLAQGIAEAPELPSDMIEADEMEHLRMKLKPLTSSNMRWHLVTVSRF